MANINVKKRLERLSTELAAVSKHASLYSGVSANEARDIDRVCSDIIQAAAHVAALARAAEGNKSGAGLVNRLRKALGFTYPI